MLKLEDGAYLVRLARRAIDHYLEEGRLLVPEDASGELKERRGVFVTLETFPDKELRGCIGYPRPIKELARACAECAVSAAVGDPRFPQLQKEELPTIVAEVSVLTLPELIKVKNPKEYLKSVKVGRDGLVIESDRGGGLLLPQVPVEWKWDEEEFLGRTCEKAGLPFDFWLTGKADIYRFQAQIFSEAEPDGEVFEKKGGEH